MYHAQPDYPAALSSLQGMTSDQLKEILNRFTSKLNNLDRIKNTGYFSEDKFEDFIKELPQMKALYGEKEMLLASNKSLAEYNLSQVQMPLKSALGQFKMKDWCSLKLEL